MDRTGKCSDMQTACRFVYLEPVFCSVLAMNMRLNMWRSALLLGCGLCLRNAARRYSAVAFRGRKSASCLVGSV